MIDGRSQQKNRVETLRFSDNGVTRSLGTDCWKRGGVQKVLNQRSAAREVLNEQGAGWCDRFKQTHRPLKQPVHSHNAVIRQFLDSYEQFLFQAFQNLQKSCGERLGDASL